MEDDNRSVNNVNDKKTELFTHYYFNCASLTLERNNKKCAKEEVLSFIRESIDCEIPQEKLEEMLRKLIQRDSINLNTLRNRECLSLPKKPPPITADTPSQNQFDKFKIRIP